ncbi:MAG: hypothetical protein ABI333_07705 [bacterium]
MDRALQILSRAGLDFVTQVVTLLGGLALLTVLLHLVERRISRRLSHRFGWRSVLVTGWLGVPLHELSHLGCCWLFRHRIIAVSLLDPDPRTGTLGYVQHAYRQRNLYQLSGNFFIGIAPLLGGSLVLLGALALLLPGARPELTVSSAPSGFGAQLGHVAVLTGATLSQMFTWSHLASWQLWVFLILALCVGTHMSPSRPDLSGAVPGLAVLLTLLLLADVANRWWALWPPSEWVLVAAGILSPLLAVLSVALVLEVVLWLLVEALVRLTTPRRGIRLGYES